MAEKEASGPNPFLIALFTGIAIALFVLVQLYILGGGTHSTDVPVTVAGTPATPGDVGVLLGGSSSVYGTLQHIWLVLVPISVFVSLLFLAGIFYSLFRLHQVRDIERGKLAVMPHTIAAQDTSRAQLRFAHIVEEANSEREQDWRLAIIEADIMLDELLDVQGYRGDTMGDKLKQIERSDFNTIDLAWEAHKIRNQIAHQGSGFSLNAREVRRVISLYEQVFKEFHYIQ